MFSRVYRARFRPEESDNVIRVARKSLPVHQGLPGFQRLTYLYDRESGLAMAVELFETREHAEATRSNPQVQQVIDAFSQYAVGQTEGTNQTPDQDAQLPLFEVIAEG